MSPANIWKEGGGGALLGGFRTVFSEGLGSQCLSPHSRACECRGHVATVCLALETSDGMDYVAIVCLMRAPKVSYREANNCCACVV